MSGEESDQGGLPGEGSVIGGRYRLGELIGSGGMGVVRAARHVTLGHELAMKFMLPALAKKPSAARRFLREARAAVGIKSDHVARVVDVGELDDGTPYMVMERLEGEDLATRLAKSGPLPVADAVAYVLQAMEAVHEAHLAGIVHRDLKPRNLFLAIHAAGEPRVKVLDFGIAKASAVQSDTLTGSSHVLGSPHYMSPEQVRTPSKVDARSDIWSLGVVLYELISGALPFEGETATAVGAAVVTDHHRPLEQRNAEVPRELSEVVDRCLTKDASGRYATLAELAAALQPFSAESGLVSVARIVRMTTSSAAARRDDDTEDMGAQTQSASRAAETQAGLTASTEPAGTPSRRRLWWLAAAALPIAAALFHWLGPSSRVSDAPRSAVSAPAVSVAAPAAPEPKPAIDEEQPASAADADASASQREPRRPFPRATATSTAVQSLMRPPVRSAKPADPYRDRK